ncbi:GNAT family N-acetyltransferase [Lewinella sp. W8]|uniref:GNAT family N-acetyltransferase n=1 Tax=Lewinella sp. W8 TaxID=2528208 RepID=UPI001067C887|nr:GNAT family N-acetyltransferase [Lewinella sp. W8]MTB51333.1 GNAT family N-acetyltransferase [Lewinella sp. W8]
MSLVRSALPSDAPAIAAIFNEYLGNGTMVLRERSEQYYREMMDRSDCSIFVSESPEGILQGYASVKPYSDRLGYHIAGEVSVFLTTAACGRGIGNALYAALWPACHALGYRHLTAKIWAENTASVRFHARHGFTEVGIQRAIGIVDDRRIDMLIMEKLLG